MKRLIISILFLLALAIPRLAASDPFQPQIRRKATLRNTQIPNTPIEKEAGIQKTEGIISMIPIVISTETKLKKNKIRITLTPTRVNFGITF